MDRFIMQALWFIVMFVVLAVVAISGHGAAASLSFLFLVTLGWIEDHVYHIWKDTYAMRARISPRRVKRRSGGGAVVVVLCVSFLAVVLGACYYVWHHEPELLRALQGR